MLELLQSNLVYNNDELGSSSRIVNFMTLEARVFVLRHYNVIQIHIYISLKIFFSVFLSNGLGFFLEDVVSIATVCAYKLNNACSENLFVHTITVMKLHLKKPNLLLIFTFSKPFLQCIFRSPESLR